MRPKLSHKKPGVLPVEESCQVDLHFSWVWVFGLQLVEDELCDDVVLHAQQVVDPVGNPGLEDVQLDLGHVNFGGQRLLELHNLHKLLLLVAETAVLSGRGALHKHVTKLHFSKYKKQLGGHRCLQSVRQFTNGSTPGFR